MDAPLVTLITPSLNQGRYLERTIQSVLAQTWPRIEYAVFDGGSTDETLGILRRYADRIFWVSQPDGGQAAAINQGLRLARGQFVGYLNADDVLEPQAVETAVRCFLRQPDWDLVYGRAYLMDENDQRLGWYDTRPFSLPALADHCLICQPAAFWRRNLHWRHGYFDEGLTGAFDYDFWLRLGAAGCRLVHVPEVLAGSRQHPSTKTNRLRVRCLGESLQVLRRNVGEVPVQHFHAYWEARASAPRWDWARLLPLLPGGAGRLAWWHYRATHRATGGSARQPETITTSAETPTA